MQLSTLIVSVFLSVVSATTTTTVKPPELITILPPHWPLCRLPAVCAARSPRVCGRAENGMCRRFKNICELLEVNRRDLSTRSKQTWTHTQERDCRRVRKVGVAHTYWCHQDCPRRPVACRRTPPEQQICVRSRNLKACKVVANRCQLLNNNCHSRPRNNWLQTDKRRCARMQIGDKPQACLPIIPTTDPDITIRPITPPSRPTTTEPPKEHFPSTTRRSSLITISVTAG